MENKKHHCAYCGSQRTFLKGLVDRLCNEEFYVFNIFCSDCKKEDWPSIRKDTLKYMLMMGPEYFKYSDYNVRMEQSPSLKDLVIKELEGTNPLVASFLRHADFSYDDPTMTLTVHGLYVFESLQSMSCMPKLNKALEKVLGKPTELLFKIGGANESKN